MIRKSMNWLSSGGAKSLLKPTGPYNVGVFDHEWSPSTNQSQVLTRFYYPTDAPITDASRANWIPSPSYLPSYGYYLKLPWWVSWSLFYWFVGSIKMWAVEKAPLSTTLKQKMPLVVFSHGIAGIRTTYSTICTELASYGMLVAAIEHRDGSASMTIENESDPQKRVYKTYQSPPQVGGEEFRRNQLNYRRDEVKSVLDLLKNVSLGDSEITTGNVLEQFKGKIDIDKTALIGHSFGAATSIYTAITDQRVKVVIALDPWMDPLPTDDFMKNFELIVINSEAFHWPKNLSSIKRLLESKSEKTDLHATQVTLLRTGHYDQSDLSSILPNFTRSRTRPIGAVDTWTALHINNHMILEFLKKVNILDSNVAPYLYQDPKIDYDEFIRIDSF